MRRKNAITNSKIAIFNGLTLNITVILSFIVGICGKHIVNLNNYHFILQRKNKKLHCYIQFSILFAFCIKSLYENSLFIFQNIKSQIVCTTVNKTD